ncbi:MAG: hypothetical protein K6F14_08225 [Clostridiales bacterium]|nr:hypothetical protein [Clostridiales bacterium]
MHSLEHENPINDLHIQNKTESRPEEIHQYGEYSNQKEFQSYEERPIVNETGQTGDNKVEKVVGSSERAVTIANWVRKMLSAFAVVLAACIVAPEIIPALATAGPEISYAYASAEEEAISYSVGVAGYLEGDELSVIVYNDFFRDEHTVKDDYIFGYVENLKPNMTYKIQVVCAGRVLLQDSLITGAEKYIEIWPSSESEHHSRE